jgi:hypothetical protein
MTIKLFDDAGRAARGYMSVARPVAALKISRSASHD